PRQNQKPTVRDHLVQVFFPRSIAPANPPIARLNTPRRSAKSQPSQPLSLSALDQIAQLRSAKRPRTQIMIPLHQLFQHREALLSALFTLTNSTPPNSFRLHSIGSGVGIGSQNFLFLEPGAR